jgi:spore coat protein H
MRPVLLLGLVLLSACTSGALDTGNPNPPPDAERPSLETPPDVGQPAPEVPTVVDAGVPDAGAPSTDAGTPSRAEPSPDRPRWPTPQAAVPTYELTLKQEDLQALHDHAKDPPSKEFRVKGRFTAEGRTYDVELGFRGRSTKTDPRITKKSWQVRFDPKERFEGQQRLELLAEWKDAGYLTEKLWYDLAASVGLRVPRARYAQVKLRIQQPGGAVLTKYEGVFTELESLTEDFLEAHGFDEDGDIYRCGMTDCELRPPPQEAHMEPWEKKTNEKQPWDRLWALLEGINRTPPHQFAAFAEQRLELDDYLTWLVVETFIANDLQGDSRSYLVYDRETGRWTYVPWDLNNALSLYNRTNAVIQGVKSSHPLLSFTAYDPKVYELQQHRRDDLGYKDMKPTYSTLSTRIYDDPELRARYVARLRGLLDTWLTEENLGPRVDAMHKLLAPFILPGQDGKTVDPYVSPEHAARSADYLRRFVRERRAWLLQHLRDLEAHGSGPLVVDRVGREASGAFWVQLYNRGSAPVSLEGLRLSGFTRVPGQWTLPALTVRPGQVVTFRQGAAGTERLGATMNPERPEVSLYAADEKTVMDLLWLAPLKPGEAYGRQPRGAESFGPQSSP